MSGSHPEFIALAVFHAEGGFLQVDVRRGQGPQLGVAQFGGQQQNHDGVIPGPVLRVGGADGGIPPELADLLIGEQHVIGALPQFAEGWHQVEGNRVLLIKAILAQFGGAGVGEKGAEDHQMIPDGDRGEAPIKEVIPVGLHGGKGGFLGGKAAFHEERIEAVCDGGVGGDGALRCAAGLHVAEPAI